MTSCTCQHDSTTTTTAFSVSNTGGGNGIAVTSSSNASAITISNTNTGGSAMCIYGSASGTSAPAVWGDGGWCGAYGKVYGSGSMGTRGESCSTAGGHGVFGCSQASTGNGHGVYGYSSATNLNYGNAGVYGYGCYGVSGATPISNNNGIGVYGTAPQYAYALYTVCDSGLNRGGYAGFFGGSVYVSGYLTKAGGGFRIDHPADPENKFLNHSFVESPEMLNIYRGRAVFDVNGEAVVSLPDYFSVANESIEYHFSPIGASMPNLFVAEELNGNSFKLAGGVAGKSVSWQVTAARADKWAKKHNPGVEIAKTDAEKGKFMHPDLFGKDSSFHIEDKIRNPAPPTTLPVPPPDSKP